MTQNGALTLRPSQCPLPEPRTSWSSHLLRSLQRRRQWEPRCDQNSVRTWPLQRNCIRIHFSAAPPLLIWKPLFLFCHPCLCKHTQYTQMHIQTNISTHFTQSLSHRHIHLTGVRRYIINQHTQPQDTIPSIFLVQRGPVWLIYQSCHLLLYTEVKDNHSQLTGGSPSTPLGKFSHTPRCCRP